MVRRNKVSQKLYLLHSKAQMHKSYHWELRGWTFNEEYPRPEYFRGVSNFRTKNKGSQINFKVWPFFFFKISIFLEDTEPNIAKMVTISEKK